MDIRYFNQLADPPAETTEAVVFEPDPIGTPAAPVAEAPEPEERIMLGASVWTFNFNSVPNSRRIPSASDIERLVQRRADLEDATE
jgi:hypothetical protein